MPFELLFLDDPISKSSILLSSHRFISALSQAGSQAMPFHEKAARRITFWHGLSPKKLTDIREQDTIFL